VATTAATTAIRATAGTEDHVADLVANRTETGPEHHVADLVGDSQDDDEAEDRDHLLPAGDSDGFCVVESPLGVRVRERLGHANELLCHISVAEVSTLQIAEPTGTVLTIAGRHERTVRQP
jgi:hypothetical protein